MPEQKESRKICSFWQLWQSCNPNFEFIPLACKLPLKQGRLQRVHRHSDLNYGETEAAGTNMGVTIFRKR